MRGLGGPRRRAPPGGWLSSYFFPTWDLVPRARPSVDEDPAGAWHALDSTIQFALDDPRGRRTRARHPHGPVDVRPADRHDLHPRRPGHTWDLARATGPDETLDPDEVHRYIEGAEPYDEMLRTSGHYGPRVEVPAGADAQTRLIAFLGRRP